MLNLNKRLIIFGGSSHLGKELYNQALNRGYFYKTYGRIEIKSILNNDFDITKFEGFNIINLAAIVGSKYLKKFSIEEIELINAILPQKLASICNKTGSKLVQISSNSIFDNSKERYRKTTTIPNSSSAYGNSKIAAEGYIKENLDKNKFLIIRTPQQYSQDLLQIEVISQNQINQFD